MIEITEAYVMYQAESKLLEIATEIAKSRSIQKAEIQEKIRKATKIRLWLEALDYKQYLDRNTRERIWYALMDIANIDNTPVTIPTYNIQPPATIVGIKGDTGETGSTGLTGGGVAFSATNVAIDTVVDSFDTSLATAAEWQYEVFNGSNKRVERLSGGWIGSTPTDDGGWATTDIGDTSGITFTVNISGSTVQLLALVTSGTWTVRGSRILIPVSGNGITLPTSLANGKVWIGNASNQPTEQTVTGDITISNTGVASIPAGVIVNNDVSNTAAIAVSKLAPMTVSKAVVTDTNGFLTTSTTDASKVAFLANVTSDIQAQINAVAGMGAITGAITTYTASNAIANRAVISNASGKLTTALTTDTEIGYLSGVTSSVQTQLNSKQNSLGYTPVNKAGDSMSGALTSTSTGEFQSGIRTEASGVFLKTKVIQIGDWNMDLNISVSIPHGLPDWRKIRSIDCIVRNDNNDIYVKLDFGCPNTQGSIDQLVSPGTDIVLSRQGGAFFDTTSFDSTGYNRGWITIIYEA